MKKGLFILLLIAILLPAHAQESGIRFFHGTWDEAMALAKKEKKKVFIDFFTEWCGPCLNMALTVFPLPEVGEVYNKNFICLKIDAEKGEGRELAKKYGIHSYPSYIFVNPKTEALIHRSGGNKPAADFIADVQGALNPKLSSIYLNEKYKSGKYDARFLIDYIHNQKVSGNRNVQKDFDKLIAMGKKLTDPEIWELYADCIGGYNNPYVKEVADHYDEFVRLFGKEAVDTKLTEATAYAPIAFTESLPEFEGKYYNLKTAELTGLFRQNKYAQIKAIIDMDKSLTALQDRKETVLAKIEAQGKLTDQLKAAIEAAEKLADVEELYLPYKEKRRTKATVAREAGLFPLARLILQNSRH